MVASVERVEGTSAGWLAAFGSTWVVFAALGRLVVVDEAALVWPALGLSIAWFLVRQAGLLSLDAAVLALAAFATIALLGASLDVAVIGAVTNAVQAPLAARLVRRWCPQPSMQDGMWGLGTPRDLAWFCTAVLLAVSVGAVLAVVGLAFSGHPVSVLLGLLLVGRNLCGGLTVATLTLAVAAPVLAGRRPARPSVAVVAETSAALAVALALLALASGHPGTPLTFLVVGVAVWVGVRGSVVANICFVCALGASVVVATLFGAGAFTERSTQASSLIVQLFVVTIFGVCMALATGRAENRRLGSQLQVAADEAAYRAQFLDQTLNAVHDGILVVDRDRVVSLTNPAAARILRVDPQDPTPLGPLLDSVVVDGARGAQLPLVRALSGDDVRDTEVHLDDRVLTISARRLDLPGPDRGRAVVSIRDVTAQHRQRTALETFAGVVAHDLQNPLGAVSGLAQLLRHHLRDSGGADAEAEEMVSRLQHATTRMSVLISELLAYATVKDRSLEVVEVRLDEVVAAVAAERGCTEEVVCDSALVLLVDAVLVRQLLDNLIGNALKFAAPGVAPRVVVTASAPAESAGSDLAVVEVSDNGIGIPAGRHEDVFAEFQRAHASTHRGHGLGLAICRRIVSNHGGTISAHDRVSGPGTTFRLTLPCAPVVPRAEATTVVSSATDQAEPVHA